VGEVCHVIELNFELKACLQLLSCWINGLKNKKCLYIIESRRMKIHYPTEDFVSLPCNVLHPFFFIFFIQGLEFMSILHIFFNISLTQSYN